MAASYEQWNAWLYPEEVVSSKQEKKPMVKINEAFATKVLNVVDKGLTWGLGTAKPGKMCVEAAVSYASGEDHDDHPSCVDRDLADLKIELNDSFDWDNDKARARGLRRLAIAQLGSAGKFSKTKFLELYDKKVMELAFPVMQRQLAEDITKLIDMFDSMRGSVKRATSYEGLDHVVNEVHALLGDEMGDNPFVYYDGLNGYEKGTSIKDCDKLVNVDYPHELAKLLSDIYPNQTAGEMAAEAAVQVLKEMKIPGTKYLYLTEKKKRTHKKRVRKVTSRKRKA